MWLLSLLNWYSDYKLKRLQMRLDAANKPFEVMKEIAAGQGAFLDKFLGMYQTTEIPSTTTLRPIDEYMIEQDREREDELREAGHNGMPSHDEILAMIGGKEID